MEKIEITQEQRRKLERLWMHFGNNGPKHTHGNHRFIQDILDRNEYHPNYYSGDGRAPKLYAPLSSECKAKVDEVIGRESQAR